MHEEALNFVTCCT